MYDFFEDEAEVSDQSGSEEEEGSRSGSVSGSDYGSEDSAGERKKKKKKNRKKKKIVLSDDEDDDEDEEIDEEADEEEGGGKKRKHGSEEEDDQLEDEDYDLIEENLGIKVQRAQKLKRIRRMVSDDEDSEKEGENDGDIRSRMTRAETESQFLIVGSEEEDEHDDGQPIRGKKKKKHIIHSDANYCQCDPEINMLQKRKLRLEIEYFELKIKKLKGEICVKNET